MVLPPQGPPLAEPPASHRPGLSSIGRSRSARPPSAPARPIVTPLIVVANVIVMALMIATGVDPMMPSGQSLVAWGSNFGLYTLGGEWWRLVTSCFLHGGLIHLAFNMYVLWDLGRLTESVYGSVGFALVYLVAGIGGAFTSVAVDPSVNSVGASGAVFGVAGAFLAFLLRNRGRIDPAVHAHLRRTLLTFVVLNVAIGFSVPGIDNSAHLGGLAMGFLSGLIASPQITERGPVRAYWAYPSVAATGVAACAAAWSRSSRASPA